MNVPVKASISEVYPKDHMSVSQIPKCNFNVPYITNELETCRPGEVEFRARNFTLNLCCAAAVDNLLSRH